MMTFLPPVPPAQSGTCFAIEPGYQQFPARCKLSTGHEGPHEAGNEHYGKKAVWSDEETMR